MEVTIRIPVSAAANAAAILCALNAPPCSVWLVNCTLILHVKSLSDEGIGLLRASECRVDLGPPKKRSQEQRSAVPHAISVTVPPYRLATFLGIAEILGLTAVRKEVHDDHIVYRIEKRPAKLGEFLLVLGCTWSLAR